MANLRQAFLLAASLATLSVGHAQPTPNVALTSLSFLSGRWVSETNDELQEETWSPISGDSITGSFRILHRGKPVFYEFWAVEIDGNRPVLKLKHFGANLIGREEKADSTRMPLISTSENDAVFTEPDGSVSLHYHRRGNLLRCTVHHVRQGKSSDEVFDLTRASE